jgi:pyrroline-5-carboxylate reductase
MDDGRSTIGLIGAGSMARAMVEGWIRADPGRTARILTTDRGSGRAAELAGRVVWSTWRRTRSSWLAPTRSCCA